MSISLNDLDHVYCYIELHISLTNFDKYFTREKAYLTRE